MYCPALSRTAPQLLPRRYRGAVLSPIVVVIVATRTGWQERALFAGRIGGCPTPHAGPDHAVHLQCRRRIRNEEIHFRGRQGGSSRRAAQSFHLRIYFIYGLLGGLGGVWRVIRLGL